MARRCPNSRFIGRAILRNYIWMINERGYANIVRAPGPGYWVEGLVFELDGDDEARLDKNEGVAKQCYRKMYANLEVHPGPKALYRRPVPWIVEKGGAAHVLDLARRDGRVTREHQGRVREQVLVYWSPDYTTNGKPKEEYVKRINDGIIDARILGISEAYISYFIRKVIPPDGQATTDFYVSPLKQPRQAVRRMSLDVNPIEPEWDSENGRNARDGERGRLRRTMRSEKPPSRPKRSQSLGGGRFVQGFDNLFRNVFIEPRPRINRQNSTRRGFFG